MATKTVRGRKPAPQPEPEPETEANGTRDYGVYASKPISTTMRTFADWLIDVTGIELPNQRAEDNFRRGVALGGTLRMDFQRSEFWRDHPDNPRSANYQGGADEEDEQPKTRKTTAGAKTTAKPATTRRGRKAEPEPEPQDDEIEELEDEETDEASEETDEVEPEPAPQPAARRRTGRRPASKAADKPATTRRRPGARAAQQDEEVEPEADAEAVY